MSTGHLLDELASDEHLRKHRAEGTRQHNAYMATLRRHKGAASAGERRDGKNTYQRRTGGGLVQHDVFKPHFVSGKREKKNPLCNPSR